MKIAIVGAPGSGKTAFGRKIAKENGIPFFDNEAQKFTKKTDLIVGFGIDSRVEIMLLAERLQTAYRSWQTDGVYTQTVLDSFAYQNIRRQFTNNTPDDLDREFFMCSVFGDCFFRTFKYDKIYHLKMFDDIDKKIEENPDYLLPRLVEAAQTDIINAFLTGAEVETIKRPPKVRRNKLEKTD